MSESNLQKYGKVFLQCCAVAIGFVIWAIYKDEQAKQSTKVPEDYWRATVVPLYELRFARYVKTNAPVQSMREFQRELQTRLDRIEATSRSNMDQDLVDMVAKHTAMDKEVLELLSECQKEVTKIGISEGSSPTQEQIEAGLKLLDDFWADPSFIERLTPELRIQIEYLRIFARYFERIRVITAEQFHDIEVMQARLQERYPGGRFSLPAFKP